MDDYISREILLHEIRGQHPDDDLHYPSWYEGMVKRQPAVDVRLVGTCGECGYAYPAGLEIKCTKHSGKTDKFGDDCRYSEYHDRNWFCADWRKSRDD